MDLLIGAHVFVDETKSRDYIMAAAAIAPAEVSSARRLLRGLLLPGQERIHFTHERNTRRRRILAEMCQIEVQVAIYVARTRDHVSGRRACMSAILDDVLAARAHHLVVEADESLVRSDRRLIADRFQRMTNPPLYRHLHAKNEPLLWISDAAAWSQQRGGEWREHCAPMVREIRRV